MAHPLYGMKKKKLPKCPNPLFGQWLREWRDEAAEKGAKSQYTYGKALKSLLKFPLELSSGKDCKILENFGDKICKMLDDRLNDHVAMYGSAVPVTVDSPTETIGGQRSHRVEKNVDKRDDKQSQGRDVARTRIPTHDLSDSDDDQQLRAGTVLAQRRIPTHNLSDSDDDQGLEAGIVLAQHRVPTHEFSDSDREQELQQPARKRQRSGRKSGERKYVPAYRSGPFAILLTLYRNMQSEDSRGFMTKAEIVRDAQKLADKSFTFPDPNCRYTAWSSMGTLIKKGLVIKESSPAKYSLTDAGCELADRLETVEEENKGNDNFCTADRPAVVPPTNPHPAAPREHQEPSLPDFPGLGSAEPVLDHMEDIRSVSRLQYWYIDDAGSTTLQKDKAVVTVNDELGVGFLIKCNYRELLKSGYRYKLDTSRPVGDDFVYAFLSNQDTEEFATPPPITGQKEKGTKRAGGSKRNTSAKNVVHDKPQLLPLLQPTTLKKTDVVVLDSEENMLGSVSDHHRSQNLAVPSLMDRIASRSGGCLATMPRIVSSESQESSQGSIKSLSSVSSGVSVRTLPDPDFILRPGEFDIVLCVDNAEFYGASKGNSKTLLPDLIKNGVECNLRKLHVGDMLWIAKEKKPPIPGQLTQPKGRELVLNYIIERKRMDDLVSSCLDGRYKEQKFRLKKCGVQNAMYLIEDYGSMQHFSIPESTIKQAITNTQVIDGFQLKRTKDSKETVAFLTVFTRYLQSSFQSKTLYACSLDKLRESDLTYSIHDTEHRLPTFEEFNQGSVKSKALTVQEMLGKQLIQLYGMSAEKARAVTEKYPTPARLFRAFDECLDSNAREILLSSIKCGKSARSLGQAQSKQISQLYNTHTALT